jgi:hypothetical protein
MSIKKYMKYKKIFIYALIIISVFIFLEYFSFKFNSKFNDINIKIPLLFISTFNETKISDHENKISEYELYKQKVEHLQNEFNSLKILKEKLKQENSENYLKTQKQIEKKLKEFEQLQKLNFKSTILETYKNDKVYEETYNTLDIKQDFMLFNLLDSIYKKHLVKKSDILKEILKKNANSKRKVRDANNPIRMCLKSQSFNNNWSHLNYFNEKWVKNCPVSCIFSDACTEKDMIHLYHFAPPSVHPPNVKIAVIGF